MCSFRVRGLLPMAVVGLCAGSAAAAPRLAFVNAAELDRGARTLIESLRPGLVQDGYETLPPGELRDALEAPLAASEDHLAQARSLLAQAKDAYAGFEFDAALEHLRRIVPLISALPYSKELLEILAERYLLEGLVHAGSRNPTGAQAAFAVVKRLHPDRELDPGTYHPRIVELYSRAGTEDREQVSLRIETTPGAKVVIDGVAVASASEPISLSLGTHYVSVDADGFIPRGAMVEVAPEITALSLPLNVAPPEARARRLRNESIATTSPAELARAAGGVCALARATVVVIVRNRAGSTFEAAVYRCEGGDLGAWVPLPSAQFFAALGPSGVTTAEPLVGSRLPTVEATQKKPRDKRWYRTWWGTGLLAGTAIALGTALYFGLQPADEFAISQWCVKEDCKP